MIAQYEKVNLAATESFAVRERQVPAFTYPFHFHPEFELTLICAGAGMRFVGDRVQPFSDGDLVFVGPNLPHCWLTRGFERPTPSHTVYVQFGNGLFRGGWAAVPELHPIRRLLGQTARGLHFSGVTRSKAAALLETLPRVRGPERFARFLSVLGLLAGASARREAVPLATPAYTFEQDDADCQRLNRIHDHILGNLDGAIDLPSVARVAHLTPTSFCRYFKRRTGKSLTAFVNEVRIGKACRILVERDLPISEAALASGFDNLSHFNRQFRRLLRCTPREFLRAQREP